MKIEIEQFGTHLSGRFKGRKDYARACEILSALPPGEIVVLDCKSVKYVSASWINSMLIPLSKRGAEEANDYFLLLVNFPKDSLDDLQLVADQSHMPFLVTGNTRASASQATIIGTLDPGQLATLTAAQKLGEVTGARLADEQGNDGIKATAWNNRLRDLYDKRLLRRRKQGREQIYTPVAKEIIYG